MRTGFPVKATWALAIALSFPGLTLAKPSDASPPPNSFGRTQSSEFRIHREDYPVDGVVLGEGWDSFLRRKTGANCVAGKVARIEGHSINFTFHRVDDAEHLFNSLSVSASGKFGGGVASGGGSATFARSVTVDTSALNMLASVFADKGGEQLAPAVETVKDGVGETKLGELVLSDDALNVLKRQGPAAFLRLCGDSFVISIRRGGTLNALLRIEAYSRDEKEKLTAEFHASGLTASGSMSINKELQNKIDHKQLQFSYMQIGGSPEVTPTDPKSLIAKLSSFASTEKFIPTPYAIYTISYKSLLNWPSNVTYTTPADLDVWANQYWRLMDLMKEYSNAGLNPQGYVFFSQKDRDGVLEVHDDILGAATFIEATLTQCIKTRECDLSGALSELLKKIGANEKVPTFGAAIHFPKGDKLAPFIELSFGMRAALSALQGNDVLSTLGPNYQAAAVVLANPIQADRILGDANIEGAVPPDGGKVSKAAVDVVKKYDWTGFDWYYYWQATKPIRAPGNGVAPEINLKGLITVAQAKLPDALKLAEGALRSRILYQRLLPFSESFCAISANHPMCLSVSRLKEIVGAVSFNLPLEAYAPDKPIPPPPTPPAPKPQPHYLEKPWGQCGPHFIRC